MPTAHISADLVICGLRGVFLRDKRGEQIHKDHLNHFFFFVKVAGAAPANNQRTA